MSRTKPRRARPYAHRTPLQSPVGRAIALQSLHEAALDISIMCYSAEHHSTQRPLIARLAFIVGTGAELAQHLPSAAINRAGLHQSLDAIIKMAQDACRWDASWCAQLNLACEISIELAREHYPLARQCMPAALGLSREITLDQLSEQPIAPFVE